MSLEHAILGFLNYGPFSGYDLKKVFDTSVQHFWPADQSQIYRTLARLADQGWAEQEVVEQEDRPDRKVYHITGEGRAELRRWLTTPQPRQDTREPTLIQVFFAGQLSDGEILVMFEREAEDMRALLEHYDQVPQAGAEYAEMVGSEREWFCWMLTLECGIANARAYLEWLDSVIERIKNGQIPQQ